MPARARHLCTDPEALVTETAAEVAVETADPHALLVELRTDPEPQAVVIHLATGYSAVSGPLVAAALYQGLQAQAEARDAYRPAGEFYGQGKSVRDVWALRRILAANQWIRTRHAPSKKTGRPVLNRPQVHAGDWREYQRRNGLTLDPLDLPADLADTLLAEAAEIERRKGAERARRSLSGG
jgi:hypothetical protein